MGFDPRSRGERGFVPAGCAVASAVLVLMSCAQSGPEAHKSSPAERACYDALANTHAYPDKIEFVSTRDYHENSFVTLRDSRGLWTCRASHDGQFTDLEPG